MADVTIRKGDRFPILARQFLTDDVATDLTSSTVVFNLWDASTGAQVITNGSCTITNAVEGRVQYAWTSQDSTLPAGNYFGSFTATFSGSRRLTAPNNGMLTLSIYAEVGSEWSYTGDPSSRPLDAIRFLIGDTNSNDQLLADNEILWVNFEASGSQTGTTHLYDAAARCCAYIASKLAREADKQIGDLRVSMSQRAAAYRDQAKVLEAQAKQFNFVPIPYAGGISISDKDIDKENSDVDQHWFQAGQFLNRRDGGNTIETGSGYGGTPQ